MTVVTMMMMMTPLFCQGSCTVYCAVRGEGNKLNKNNSNNNNNNTSSCAQRHDLAGADTKFSLS
jgi:hypothetical protein